MVIKEPISEETPLLNNSDNNANNNESCCASKACCSSNPTSACCSSMPDQPCLPTRKDDDDYCHLAEQPWEYKMVALACALFLAVGSHFAAHTLGAMKSKLKEEFGISNAQYGAIQSSVAIVNTVLPVLGGIFIDAFGTIAGSILTTVLITSGNVMVAISTSNASLMTMIIGRILYGIGSGSVVIVQETILSQWFRGRSLAVVVALMLTVSRLASFSAQATVVPIARWTGWWGYAFWFSASLCIFSLFVNFVYIALLRSVSKPGVACKKQLEVLKRKKSFKWGKLLYLPHSYWLIAIMEFLLGGGWGCFLHINSEFVKFRFGYDDGHAAAIASLAQIMPVFLMPVLGMCIDRYGKRTWMMIGSGACFLFSMLLLNYTKLMPVFGMLLFSVSLSLGPVGLVSAVPVILPLSLVGTGMGLIKSSTNIGAALFDIATGLLQDHDQHKGYTGVILFFIALSVLAVVAGVVLCVLDRKIYRNLLDRAARDAWNDEEPKMLSTSEPQLVMANYIYGGIYLALAVLSWVLFIRFLF
ncbi:hypothetical protein EC973_006368 [Apophysomyces ossiformis]|uniref:Lysosomal dipeptide transporter MFSD1 n=1 Tax=Apophysomyces ossiformis TaxID=679940 RepID=A0A8H7BWD2_9FUNG|nr:hypothetical protein EC973_006368 [Apophysomyces ossiformis]